MEFGGEAETYPECGQYHPTSGVRGWGDIDEKGKAS